MSHLRTRLSISKVFLISGVEEELKKVLVSKISKLGGTYLPLQGFKASCTHVICGKLTRSEKYLGACATGRWVVHPSYVIDSDRAGDWLDEEQYEWCDENISRLYPSDQDLAISSRRWRFLLGSGEGAFTGWKVAVVAGQKRAKVIKRLLKSGGAELYNLKLPLTNPGSIVNTIGYIFVTDLYVPHVPALAEYGMLCIKPEFIADFLLKNPPADPMDYLQQMSSKQGSSQGDTPSDFFEMSYSSPVSAASSQVSLKDDREEVEKRTGDKGKGKGKKGQQQRQPSHSGSAITDVTVIDSDDDELTKPSFSVPAVPTARDPVTLHVDESQIDTKLEKQIKVESLDLSSNRTESNDVVIDLTGSDNEDGVEVANQVPAATTARKDADDADIPAQTIVSSQSSKDKDKEALSDMKGSKSELKLPTSTPAKGAAERRLESLINMSPITKYFKQAVPLSDASQNASGSSPVALDPDSVTKLNNEQSAEEKPSSSKKDNIFSTLESMLDESVRRHADHGEVFVIKSKVETTKQADVKPISIPSTGSFPSASGIPSTSTSSIPSAGDLSSTGSIQSSTSSIPSVGSLPSTSTSSIPSAGSLPSTSTSSLPSAGILPSTSNMPSTSTSSIPSSGNKRKCKLTNVLKELKRQKISCCEWRPTSFEINFRDGEDESESLHLPNTLSDIIHETMEDHFTIEALKMIHDRVSLRYQPQPRTLRAVLNIMLQTANEQEAELASSVLHKVLRLHPPVAPTSQELYKQALVGAGRDRSMGSEWDMINTCFRNILSRTEEQTVQNSLKFLRFMKTLLHLNLQHCLLKDKLKTPMKRHLLLWILWYPSYVVTFNTRCQQLLDHFSRVVAGFQPLGCADNQQIQMELVETLCWMVAMVAECIRRVESSRAPGMQCLLANTTSVFVKAVAKHLKDMSRWCDLQYVLMTFQLPWFSTGLCMELLLQLDDRLCQDTQVQQSVSLVHIVTHHMFLLPRFCLHPGSVQSKQAFPGRKSTHVRGKQSAANLSTAFSQSELTKHLRKAMKRNPKGETALHTACIKNNVEDLRQFLKIPGIDVNVKDYAGWTPLHEACNHGSVECVKELLDFVPLKSITIDGNLNTEVMTKKVDILATDEEGITPLHEAVQFERVEVCRLLLQHGGPAILNKVTRKGFSPLQYARNVDMFNLLSSFNSIKQGSSKLQESFSSSQALTLSLTNTLDLRALTFSSLATRFSPHVCSFLSSSMVGQKKQVLGYAVYVGRVWRPTPSSAQSAKMARDSLDVSAYIPSDAQYHEATHHDGVRIYADQQPLLTYIHLLTACIKFYIQATYLDEVHTQFLKRKSDSQETEGHESMCSAQIRQGSELGQFDTDKKSSLPYSKNDLAHRTEQPNSSATDTDDVNLNEEVEQLQKDLLVLSHLDQYVEIFRTHVTKIRHQKDTRDVESALLELTFLADNYSSSPD